MKAAAYDFANILFAGPCNRSCPFCIGKEVAEQLNQPNLDLFPLRNLDGFVDAVQKLAIDEIVFTGTTTDPQLYRHEQTLLDFLRQSLPGRKYSVHTNGVLSLRKLATFNSYDRACISFPSFEPEVYRRMMGAAAVPDLAKIVQQAKIPVKVSCVVNEYNASGIDGFLRRLSDIGVRRVVLRNLFGDKRDWRILHDSRPIRFHRGNPVHDFDGMEVTVWDFERSESRSINLFADGTIGEDYLITQTLRRESLSAVRQEAS